MYAPQSLHDFLFLMLYGGVVMFAIAAGIYLWLRRSNAIAPDVTPPEGTAPMDGSLLHHGSDESCVVVYDWCLLAR